MDNTMIKTESEQTPDRATQHVGRKKQLAVNYGSIWHRMGGASGVTSVA